MLNYRQSIEAGVRSHRLLLLVETVKYFVLYVFSVERYHIILFFLINFRLNRRSLEV